MMCRDAHATRPRAATAGFTLIEAIVSLFVFGLISAGCVLLLVQTAQGQARLESSQERLRGLQTLQAMVARDAAQAVARPIRATSQTSTPAFFGQTPGEEGGVAMAFVRLSEAGEGDMTRLVRVRYIVRGGTVWRTTAPAFALENNAPVPADQAILSGAQAITPRFHDGLAWRQDWPAAQTAGPRAVGFTVTFADGVSAPIAALMAPL